MTTHRLSAPRTTAFFLVLAAVLSSCASRRGTSPENAYQGTEGVPELEVDEANLDLARKLVIGSPLSKRRNDRLWVQFDLESRHNREMAVEYFVDWFDAEGFSVSTRQSWKTVTVGPHGSVPISITAPTHETVTWKLHVRKPNPIR